MNRYEIIEKKIELNMTLYMISITESHKTLYKYVL